VFNISKLVNVGVGAADIEYTQLTTLMFMAGSTMLDVIQHIIQDYM